VLTLKHLSPRTIEAYVGWVRRYVRFHGTRHPAELGGAEVARFLSWLAQEREVSASTQTQAASALVFLYRELLDIPLGRFEDLIRAPHPKRLPVVLTRSEVAAVMDQLEGTPRLVCALLYGSGLRLLEALHLRVKDVDLGLSDLTVRRGKGDKDRVTMVSQDARAMLIAQLGRVEALHRRDLARDAGQVVLPGHWHESTRRRIGQSPGSGCFRRPGSPCWMPRAGGAGTTCMSRWSSGRCSRRYSGRDFQARDLSHVTPQLRDAPAGGRVRHPDGAGAVGASRREHDDDLHARAEPGAAGGAEPGRSAVTGGAGGGRG
jgi:hypothetical protein